MTAPIRPRACTRANEHSESNHRERWDVRPTLERASATGPSLARAAGSFVAGSPLPQALIQCRQRLTDELRLCMLVILSGSAPQPVADDSAVAQPSTASSLVSSAPQNGPGTRRHATSCARCRSAHIIARRAGWMYAPVFRDLTRSPEVSPSSGLSQRERTSADSFISGFLDSRWSRSLILAGGYVVL